MSLGFASCLASLFHFAGLFFDGFNSCVEMQEARPKFPDLTAPQASSRLANQTGVDSKRGLWSRSSTIFPPVSLAKQQL